MSEDGHLEISLLDLQRMEVDKPRILDVARRTAESEGATGELSIVLVDSARMAEMNQLYRKETGPTDVLSFSIDGLISGGIEPGDTPPFIIGEVIVCPEVARIQAATSLASEMDLLIAHGILHLFGYDHETEQQAADMRKRERDLTGRSGASAS